MGTRLPQDPDTDHRRFTAWCRGQYAPGAWDVQGGSEGTAITIGSRIVGLLAAVRATPCRFVLQFRLRTRQSSESPCTSSLARGTPSPVVLYFCRFSSSCRAWYS